MFKKILIAVVLAFLVAQIPFAYRRYKLRKLGATIRQLNSQRTQTQSNLTEYKGVIHVHSFLGGHSSGSFSDIIAAAQANQLDFVIMTEHTERDFDTAAMTIVITRASDVRRGSTALVARLAEIAVNDELLVVCGSNEFQHGPDANVLTLGLRRRLPRHDVVALHVAPNAGAPRRAATLLSEFMEIGSLPLVVTPVAAVRDVVAELSSYLRADRVLSLSCSTADGANLRQVWARRQTVSARTA